MRGHLAMCNLFTVTKTSLPTRPISTSTMLLSLCMVIASLLVAL